MLPELKIGKIPSDLALAAGILLLLSVLIVPLPSIVLDMGLAVSVSLTVLILMVAVFLENPLDFSSFPVVLLLTTLLRIALNVATTRLILSHGHEGLGAAGHIVAAFGGFLMGGDAVIGLVVFGILLIVNFMVITKGSGRIAEVAARFTLDAMPGRQMAIDADLSAGTIDEATARRRRSELEQESSFFGSMDGAAKFVRGDAIAGLMITSVNIFGGLAIGVIKHGLSLSDAVQTYTTLTIGDGLVSQIPALLVSTASGIVITKAGVKGKADIAIGRQMGGSAKPLFLAAAASGAFGLMPGLPALPFLLIAAGFGGLAWTIQRRPAQAESDATTQPPAPVEPPVTDLLKMDVLRIELGYGLLSLATGDNITLTDQIKHLRRTIAVEYGFIIPAVRIQDNLQLGSNLYAVKLREITAGQGELRANALMVMSQDGRPIDFPGEPTLEPAFNLQALWIDPALRDEAVIQGLTVVEPARVLSTHLTEIVMQNLSDLLDFGEVNRLLELASATSEKLIGDLIPARISMGSFHRILQRLLAERVSIRDLGSILEAVHDATVLNSSSITAIVAHVRARLSRQICSACQGPGGYVPLITLSPEWEAAFLESLSGPPPDQHLAMAPSRVTEFVTRLKSVIQSASAAGEIPVVLTGSQIRFHVRSIVERISPSTAVLAQSEIFARANIRTVGTIQ